jgi:serine/threonine protein kinase
MRLTVGSQLGRYEVRSFVGAGGMGEVYLAHDTKLDRAVALKLLPQHAASDHERIQRFLQEAKTASALNHPNIITIHEIEEYESGYFITTEFIDGETLRAHLTNAPLTLAQIYDVTLQIASALSAAHREGIIHRDIKPENVMLRRDGIVKVLDFGLAKIAGRTSGEVDADAETIELIKTDAGSVVGTVFYMSPEQLRAVALDARVDVWSLGVVLYEMLTGQRPFDGKTNADVTAAVLSTPCPPTSNFRSGVPNHLEEIILKALEKERENRYQSIQELIVDLRRSQRRFEAGSRDIDSISGATREVGRPPSNLPELHTPIVGRSSEIAEITDQLRQAEVRLQV